MKGENRDRFLEPPDLGNPPVCEECSAEDCPNPCPTLDSFLEERNRAIAELEARTGWPEEEMKR